MRWDYFVKHYADEKQAAKNPKMTWMTPEGKTFVGLTPPEGSKQTGILYPRAGTLGRSILVKKDIGLFEPSIIKHSSDIAHLTGGCVSHNACIAVLPPDSDWQYIADLTGDKSWEPNKCVNTFSDSRAATT